MGFLDDVKAATEKGKPSKTVEVSLNGKVYELKFYRADGDVWAETVARHPARLDSQIDVRFGYNFNAVVLDIGVTTGRVLEDGAEVEIPQETWEAFVHALSGHEVGKIADAVWALNEWDPIQEIEKAKKASKSRGSRGKSA
jgi:hypothetical protein